MLVGDLALELQELGREAFRAHYGLFFVVFTQRDLIDQASDFVNTSSRDIGDILAGRIERHAVIEETEIGNRVVRRSH